MTKASADPAVHIGISGWRYAPWRGKFYPAGLAQRQELAFASRVLPTIEINGSFYSLQQPSSYEAWRDDTPAGFVFAVKGPRYITHLRRLNDVRVPLANFFASGVLALGDKLGPILWQFPPRMAWEPERFEAFFSLLPATTAAALKLAREHDDNVAGRTWLHGGGRRRLRHAVEVRDPSFVDPAFIAQLRRHGIALVVADTAGRWPLLEDLTADFVYLRLHGDKKLYASGYGEPALAHWARRIAAWRQGRQVRDAKRASKAAAPRGAREVFCYFDNDIKVHAPYDAAHLAQALGLPARLEEGARDRFALPPGISLRPARKKKA